MLNCSLELQAHPARVEGQGQGYGAKRREKPRTHLSAVVSIFCSLTVMITSTVFLLSLGDGDHSSFGKRPYVGRQDNWWHLRDCLAVFGRSLRASQEIHGVD